MHENSIYSTYLYQNERIDGIVDIKCLALYTLKCGGDLTVQYHNLSNIHVITRVFISKQLNLEFNNYMELVRACNMTTR